MTYVFIHVLIYLHSLFLLVSEMCIYIYTRTYKIHNLRVSICWTIHTHIASNRHVNILIIWWSTHISGFYQQWFLFPNQIHTVSTIWMVNQKLMISISWQFLDMCIFWYVFCWYGVQFPSVSIQFPSVFFRPKMGRHGRHGRPLAMKTVCPARTSTLLSPWRRTWDQYTDDWWTKWSIGSW